MLERFQGDRAVLLGAVGIISVAMIGSGYLLGDGLRRAKMAERSVTVRGVSERDVTADLATWTISFSEEGRELGRSTTWSKRRARPCDVSSSRPGSSLRSSAIAASA